MSVADLAREAARRYVGALPFADWARELLERVGVPLALRQPAHVDELDAILRRVAEEQALEHFTVAELAAPARFYATPEGRVIALAFTEAAMPALEAALVAWARALVGRVRPKASAGEAAP